VASGSLRAEFLYVSYGSALLSYGLNNNTGSITPLPGSPLPIADGVGPLVLDRSGQVLYASTGGNIFADTWGSISGYHIKHYRLIASWKMGP
jgi:hypothetical protein